MADKIKITEPNGGKHIAIAGDVNSILASKDDTGGTYSILEENKKNAIAFYKMAYEGNPKRICKQ